MGNGMPQGTALGPIGDKIIVENEAVRVWHLSLKPGETQPWHQHELPYLVIPLTKGANVMRFADGSSKPTSEMPGQAHWREPGKPHELQNTSNHTYENILVEIKRAE